MFILFSALVAIFLSAAPSPCSMFWADERPLPPGQENLILEGQAYRLLRIGAQTWLGENLRATRDRNGDALIWVSSGGPDPEGASGGRLYPWEAACRAAPAGWRLPTVKDWQALLAVFEGGPRAGRQLLATGSGEFGALLIGGVDVLGRALGRGEEAVFWTSAETSVDLAFCLKIGRDGRAEFVPRPKVSCFAVRLIRADSPQLAVPAPSPGGRFP